MSKLGFALDSTTTKVTNRHVQTCFRSPPRNSTTKLMLPMATATQACTGVHTDNQKNCSYQVQYQNKTYYRWQLRSRGAQTSVRTTRRTTLASKCKTTTKVTSLHVQALLREVQTKTRTATRHRHRRRPLIGNQASGVCWQYRPQNVKQKKCPSGGSKRSTKTKVTNLHVQTCFSISPQNELSISPRRIRVPRQLPGNSNRRIRAPRQLPGDPNVYARQLPGDSIFMHFA